MFSPIVQTCAPVSSFIGTIDPFTENGNTQSLSTLCTCTLSMNSSTQSLSSETELSDSSTACCFFDLQHFLKCPFNPHLRHSLTNAEHFPLS